MARFHDVRIWNIKATGATTAFEVDGFKEAPLERFQLDNIDIEARNGGHIYDARDWKFSNTNLKLGSPVALENRTGVAGLDFVEIKPVQVKEDPSKKSFEEQDKS